MNRRVVLPIFLIIALVSACSPSASQPIVSIPTNTSQPTVEPTISSTATPTLIPLSQLKLDSLLVQTGDLPAGLSGAQIRDIAPGMFKGLPSADNTIYQQFARGGNSAGGVAVFLYEDELKAKQAYDEILNGMTSNVKPISDIGEKASVAVVIGFDLEGADFVFTRCDSVVHIRFSGTSNLDEIESYARRLDRRLDEVVCR